MKKNSRESESLAPKLTTQPLQNKEVAAICLSAPSDIGVRRNKGRNGARYAPLGVLNILKKQNDHILLEGQKILDIQVSSQVDEQQDFHKAQEQSAFKIGENLKLFYKKPILHIGGGHDHAFPLLHALNSHQSCKKILILNIDAHCDTRIDNKRHSGTPFRDFDEIAKTPFHLIQFGLQKSANSKTTLTPLKNGSYENYFMDDIARKSSQFSQEIKDLFDSCPFEIDQDTCLYLSLDCDAIDGSNMKAVSAVNGRGLPSHYMHLLIEQITKLNPGQTVFGIYEYNPVFDDLSQLGARTISSFIYNFLMNNKE